MKYNVFFYTLLVFCLVNTSLAFSQSADAVLGIWRSEHGSAKIQISKSGDQYDGKLVWVKPETGSDETDINNPNPELRSQPIEGLEVLKNFTYSGSGTWDGGTVYDPRSGKTYSCKLYMESSDELEVRAYMGISLIGKSQTWSRVK